MSLFELAGGRYLRAFCMLFQVEESNYFEYWESDDYVKNERYF